MSDRKNILLIATGGTIASKKSDNGLKPQISPEELMQYIPQVKDICDFHVVQLLNLDSSNMEPKHWKMMVHTIRENYEKYWDDIAPFIKFGYIKDEKFAEHAGDRENLSDFSKKS